MKFQPRLIPGRLIRRYKRFLADMILEDGRELTAHCPNTGAMLGCQAPDSRVWLSYSDNAARKYPWTWEIVETARRVRVGINTARSNQLVAEAIDSDVIGELSSYPVLQREVRVGAGRSRIDFRLHGDNGKPDCFVEVKNVTAAVERGVAVFPDAVSTRGTRHLRELMQLSEQGHRAVLCFCVQRDDVAEVRPASEIDPVYASTLAEAAAEGVETIAYRAEVSPSGIRLYKSVPVNLA